MKLTDGAISGAELRSAVLRKLGRQEFRPLPSVSPMFPLIPDEFYPARFLVTPNAHDWQAPSLVRIDAAMTCDPEKHHGGHEKNTTLHSYCDAKGRRIVMRCPFGLSQEEWRKVVTVNRGEDAMAAARELIKRLEAEKRASREGPAAFD